MSARLTIRDFADLTPEESAAIFAEMTPAERAAKLYDWSFWARDDQMLPDGDWVNWLPLAGRGWGKTRTGAETVRQWIAMGFNYVNLIAATHDDLASVMIHGESGIIACCPPDEKPRYVKQARELRWPNGAKSLVFSAEEPDRLRGKQHMKLWCDELAAWRYTDAWDQAMLGLRLGSKPQVLITTTPRPTKIIKDLRKDPQTHFTTGSTYENAANLADVFISKVVGKYEGTRLGRQELGAEILDDMPGALFNREQIDRDRIEHRKLLPPMSQIVVAIDPAVSTGEDADETGIVVCGLGDDKHGYVLEDASGVFSPTEWAREAVRLYRRWHANKIVGEVNNGGDMVEAVLRMENPNLPFKAVHATRGKAMRAEPVSLLYEQHKVHHLGTLAKLEDQLCVFTSDFDRAKAGYSPDRLDAMVWGLTELMVGMQNDGIIHFMRAEMEEAQSAAIKANAPPDPNSFVRLRCPEGVQTAYGRRGTRYIANAQGCIDVEPDDVGPLGAAGFVSLSG